MTFTHEPELRVDGPDTFLLLDGLYYEGREDIFVVPAGFVTDFASVPRFATWLIPRFGKYTKAAILHDWLCVRLANEHSGPLTGPIPRASAVDTDGLFRRVMREEGVSWLQRWLMWTGVRWGALANPARRAGWFSWRETPKVLAISLLALPLVLPAAVVVLASQGVFWALDVFTGARSKAGVNG